MQRAARRRLAGRPRVGYGRLVTCILDTEPGTSLRAAGWKLVGLDGGGSWSGPSRPRVDSAPTCGMLRWEVTAINR